MKSLSSAFFLLLLFCGCAARTQSTPETLSSVQIIDRNGFSETISAKQRLEMFNRVDFLQPQPYQKVMRVFGRGGGAAPTAKITSYHSNGQLWQYLEVSNGRANGTYREWHPNGKLRLDAYVIEGLADIGEKAQMSWIFDGVSYAYDEEGRLVAEIPYNKGALDGLSSYYHPSGALSKVIPYCNDLIEGEVLFYDAKGALLEKVPYAADLRQGWAEAYWGEGQEKYRERYEEGLLVEGVYHSPEGTLLAGIKEGEGKQAVFKGTRLHAFYEYQKGAPCGKVEIFDREGNLRNLYHVRGGKKEGEEWEFYPRDRQPKLCVHWHDDQIQGMVKTWYANGVMESEREVYANKKHGLSFAWYEEGQIMLVEEYESDTLRKGTYFKKGDKLPVSKVDNGKGTATLYDSKGHFLKKISYEQGQPALD